MVEISPHIHCMKLSVSLIKMPNSNYSRQKARQIRMVITREFIFLGDSLHRNDGFKTYINGYCQERLRITSLILESSFCFGSMKAEQLWVFSLMFFIFFFIFSKPYFAVPLKFKLNTENKAPCR